MATSRDVQEVVSKLSSDKAKAREEGIKLLNTWLEGERSVGFCKLLRQNTLKLKPDEIPHSETWPFLVTLLVKCVTLEISGSKKRPPKLSVAKTLRTVVQRAEDVKLSGKEGLLLAVVKPLFSHIWDVIKDVEIFQSEYSIMLRQLLTVKEYCYHMRKRIYNNFLLLYMDKVGLALAVKDKNLPNTKEEIFRSILTLHILLENPPGDFPDDLREDIVKKFVEIFSHLREEGKISRKLMECINIYLLKDGPNLGSKTLDIHFCLQEFVFHYWVTTHDKGLKNSLIVYSSLQLKLIRSSEISPLIERLLGVLDKEFDQSNDASVGMPRSDTSRDDYSVTMGSSQQGLMELIASVYYQVCTGKIENLNGEKRLRRENPADDLKDGIMKGKWLCCASFYFLIYHYGLHMDISLLAYWLEDISRNFERILNDSGSLQFYDGIIWLLRILNDSGSLQFYDGIIWLLRALGELSSVLHVANLDISKSDSSPVSYKIEVGWCTIWNALVHGLPIFSNISPLADAALSLLGTLISKECVHVPIVPKDLWDLRIFKHLPSSFALYFMACYFSRSGVQGKYRGIGNTCVRVLQPMKSEYFNQRQAASMCSGSTSLLKWRLQGFKILGLAVQQKNMFMPTGYNEPYQDTSQLPLL